MSLSATGSLRYVSCYRDNLGRKSGKQCEQRSRIWNNKI